MSEARFRGVVEYSGESRVLALLSSTYFPLGRLVIADDTVTVEARWRLFRSVVPTRTAHISQLVSVRLRGTLVILSFPDDKWWSVSADTRCTKIMREFESRGVAMTRDP